MNRWDQIMNNESLEARITRIEDIESIKQLKARYCEVCDDDHNSDEIIKLFTSDGIWEGDGIGRAQGSAEIKALFETFKKAISFSQHMVQNPIIEVTGEKATARWYFFGTFKYYRGEQARWQAARYHEIYQKIADRWHIKHLKIAEPVMSVKYETGW